MGEALMTLKGNLGLNKFGISLRAMMKALQNESQGVLIELEGSFSKSAGLENELRLAEGVQRVLQKHQQVFRDPHGLSPN